MRTAEDRIKEIQRLIDLIWDEIIELYVREIMPFTEHVDIPEQRDNISLEDLF